MKRFASSLASTLALAGLFAACTMHKAGASRDDSKEEETVYNEPVVEGGGEALGKNEPPRQDGEPMSAKPERPETGTDGVDPYAALGGDPGDSKRLMDPGPTRPTGRSKESSARQSSPRGLSSEQEAGYNDVDPYAPPSPRDVVPDNRARKPKAASAESYGSSPDEAGAPIRRLDGHCLSLDCRPVPPPYQHQRHPRPYRPPAPRDGEEYAAIHENAFQDARLNPLSTFSIDVDGASYANVRRFLQENRLPPPDAVRIEELINTFSYDYPSPHGVDPFTITTETAVTPWNPDTRLVLIGLQGRRIEERRLPPSNLVFLIDVSGSMATPDKLPLLKDAFDMLVDRLRPQDRISIVVYAGAAGMVLPPTRGDDKEAIREALGRLDAGGSTAGGAGLMLAYQAARQCFIQGGNNRVILATDGDFNVGLSGDEELTRFIEAKRKTGVYLSVLGFGTGNYKDSKMEALADKGNGNYYYIDGIHEARKVMVERMSGTLHAIAKDVKLQVEFNPAAVKSYRLIGYENRVLAAEDFNDDAKDAGELGVGHSVTALYEVVPASPERPGVDPLKYQDTDRGEGSKSRRWAWGFGGGSGEMLTVKFRYKQPNASESRLLSRVLKNRDRSWREASENFRFAVAVAGFGLLLRESRYRGDLGYDQVIAMARGAKGRDANGDRAEFVHLAGTAKLLAETEAYGMPER